MFLSSCELNPVRRGARRLIGSPQAMHAAVMSCFPRSQADRAGRVLWRLDQTENSVLLYIVSGMAPDFTSLVEQAGWPQAQSWRTMPYERILDSIKVGNRYSFRFTANPTHSIRTNGGTDTKRFGHITVAQQERWLLDRGIKNGFQIPQVSQASTSSPDRYSHDELGYAFQVVRRSTLSFRRTKEARTATVTLSQATYAGVLTVTDTDCLRSALVNGIGPAKAYGCGLMTLAKPPTGEARTII